VRLVVGLKRYLAVNFGTRHNSYKLQKLPGFPQPQYVEVPRV
jgi:hypothetical protein